MTPLGAIEVTKRQIEWGDYFCIECRFACAFAEKSGAKTLQCPSGTCDTSTVKYNAWSLYVINLMDRELALAANLSYRYPDEPLEQLTDLAFGDGPGSASPGAGTHGASGPGHARRAGPASRAKRSRGRAQSRRSAGSAAAVYAPGDRSGQSRAAMESLETIETIETILKDSLSRLLQNIDERLERQRTSIEASVQRSAISTIQAVGRVDRSSSHSWSQSWSQSRDSPVSTQSFEAPIFEAPAIPESPSFRPGDELAENYVDLDVYAALGAEPELPERPRVPLVSIQEDDEMSESQTPTGNPDKKFSLRAGSVRHMKPARQDSYELAKREEGVWVRSEMSGGAANVYDDEQKDGNPFHRCTAKVVRTWQFETFFALLIFAHAILLGAQIDWECRNLNKELPREMARVHIVFTAFFLLEIIMRILGFGVREFCTGEAYIWNLIDVFLVLIAIVENLADALTEDADLQTIGSFRILRILRLARSARGLRVVRLLRFIRPLRLLVFSIAVTLKSLVWSVILLFIIIYLFSILFADANLAYFTSEGHIPPTILTDSDLQSHFGSVQISMHTLFRAICGGLEWRHAANSLDRSIGWGWSQLFTCYMAFCCFAVLNVMTGETWLQANVFCHSAIASAEQDHEIMVQSMVNEQERIRQAFADLFRLMDKDGSGTITIKEFEKGFHVETTKALFEALGLKAEDAWTLFRSLDKDGDGDHRIGETEFVQGCINTRGPARQVRSRRVVPLPRLEANRRNGGGASRGASRARSDMNCLPDLVPSMQEPLQHPLLGCICRPVGGAKQLAMVLGELGQRITASFRRLNQAPIIDDDLLDEVLKEIAAALLHADVNVRYVSELRSNVKKRVLLESDASGVNKRKLIQKAVVEELVRLVSTDRKPYKLEKGKCNIIMFVGLQGSGKTTTCTKYAHHYNRKGWKTALVCADTFRAGAFDQLKQNASKVRIPFYGDYNETDPVKIAEEGVELFKKEKYDLIIVDTSGRHKQEAALFDEMQQVAEVVAPNDIIFIMDSHIGQACFDQAKAFREVVDIGSVIITKLDGHAKGGGALSAVSATNSPIIFLGTGEHFDEFQPFDAQSFVSRLLGMGDLKGLFQTITEAMPLDKQPELLNKISKGRFSLRDLYEQFQNLQKMGPMSQLMQMIPGMSNLMPAGAEKEGVKRIKRFMVIMDSMTDTELDCEVQLNDSRKLRIARGAGASIPEVNLLIDEYKRMEKMVGKMGKSGLFGKGGELTQLSRNPGQVMQKMQSAMDPRMLQQMGGAQNMMKMMKEFGKMENMGGMMEGLGGIDPAQVASMQKMMGGKMKGRR
eukprot:s182_g56.t1